MTLLDNGPDTVTVYPKVNTGFTRYNTPKLVDGPPEVFKGVTVEPFGQTAYGGQPDEDLITEYTVKGRGIWPGGLKTTVDWNGRRFDQHGEARQYHRGMLTKHFYVRIKARGAEVK